MAKPAHPPHLTPPVLNDLTRVQVSLPLCQPRSLHDRKMCVLGLCALIDLEHRPQVVNQAAGQILPAAILLFNGLKRAYACRAEHENDDDDDDDGEEDDDNGRGRALDSRRAPSLVTRVIYYSVIPCCH